MALPQAGVELVAMGSRLCRRFYGKGQHGRGRVRQQGRAERTVFSKGFGDIVTGVAAGRRNGGHRDGRCRQGGDRFLTDSVDVAGDFEAGMLNFQAVAGKGVDTAGWKSFMTCLSALGRELPVSTSEVQQAAIEMVSGGIDPAIVAGGGLRQTLQFAAASGMSLADAAQTSAKFLAGWTSSAATTEEGRVPIKQHRRADQGCERQQHDRQRRAAGWPV